MKKDNIHTSDITPSLESIRLAAQDNNASKNGGSKRKRKNLVMLLQQKTDALQKQDVHRWRQAWQMAINVENPKRLALYEIYRDACVDMHLTGCFTQRYYKTLLKSFVILDNDGNEADDALRIFDAKWFHHFLLRALESIAWGHSLIQLGDVVEDANGTMKFSDVFLVPRDHVCPEFGVLLRERGDSPDQGIPYREGPLADWCVEVGDPQDLGVLLKCCPHTLAKKNVTAYWDIFGEIFGMPMRIATTTSQNPADHRRIEGMLENMGTSPWMLAPDGTSIEIKESSRGDAYNVYDRRIDRANSELSKGIVGQTMTIEDGSANAQAIVHMSVLDDIVKLDCINIAHVVNDDLIPKMIRLGFPLEGLHFAWDNAATYSPSEQRELERMLLQYFDIDEAYFTEKYKIPITGTKQQGGAFFE